MAFKCRVLGYVSLVMLRAMLAHAATLKIISMDKLLDVDELAHLLGRNAGTIKKDLKRNPFAVPPRVHLPGTRLLRWRPRDVEQWLEEHIIEGGQR